MLLIEQKVIEEIKTYVKQTRHVDTINLLSKAKEVEVVDITQLANKSEHELYVMEKYKGYKLIKVNV